MPGVFSPVCVVKVHAEEFFLYLTSKLIYIQAKIGKKENLRELKY